MVIFLLTNLLTFSISASMSGDCSLATDIPQRP